MQLDEQARLVAERGMVLVGNEEEDEDVEAVNSEEQEKRTRAIVSSDTAGILGGLGPGPLDVRIKRLADDRDDLQVRMISRIFFPEKLTLKINRPSNSCALRLDASL